MAYSTASESRLDSLWRSPPFRQVAGYCIFAVAYYSAFVYGIALGNGHVATFWFPDTVLLCVLLLKPPREWWIYFAGALPIRLFAPAANQDPTWFLMATYVLDGAKTIFLASVMRAVFRNPIRITSLKEYGIFSFLAVLVVPAISATFGAAANHLRGLPYWPVWQGWFLADALTHAVVTPAVLWCVFAWKEGLSRPSPKRLLEGGAVAMGLIVTTQMAFTSDMNGLDFPMSCFYASLPLLFWAAIRFGMAGASGAVGILTVCVANAAMRGWGPFFHKSPTEEVLILQEYLLFRSVPLYLVAILLQQRDEAEYSLRESEERFRVMADTAPVLMWIASTDKMCVFFNRSWLNFTGRAMVQELGNGWADGVHPEDLKPCLKIYSASFDARQPIEIEYRLRRHDGEYRWVMDRGVPRYAANGDFLGYVGTVIDLTDRKLAEEARQELVHASRLAVVGEFTAMVAHELNQPLNAILNNIDAARTLLNIKIVPVDELRQIVADIRADNLRASEAIRRIRALVSKREMEMQLLDMNATVAEVVRLAKADAFRRGVRMHGDCQAPFATVRGDVVHLQQVVLNLIINGMDAMKDNPESDRHLYVSTSSHDDSVEIAVRDVGQGIPPEDLRRIFDSFFTTKPDGMGIGLSMSRSIVQWHTGRIWAENNKDGRGTTFRISLPAAVTSTSCPTNTERQGECLVGAPDEKNKNGQEKIFSRPFN